MTETDKLWWVGQGFGACIGFLVGLEYSFGVGASVVFALTVLVDIRASMMKIESSTTTSRGHRYGHHSGPNTSNPHIGGGSSN